MEQEAREPEHDTDGERLPGGSGGSANARAGLAQGRPQPVGDRRFLSKPMAAWLGAYLVFAFTFASLRVNNDGVVYYNFLRRFVGDNVGAAYAYQFGSAFFDLPFYLVAKAFRGITGVHSVLGAPVTEASIAVASTVALVATLYLGWRMLLELELPAGPSVLMLALFGSPLFYYTVFEPSYKHAVDALVATLYAFLLLRLSEAPSARLLWALGALLGVLISIRYVNFVLGAGPLVVLAWQRRPRAAVTFLAAALTATLLVMALPQARHIPYKRPVTPNAPAQAAAPQLEIAAIGVPPGLHSLCFDHTLKIELNFVQCMRNRFGIQFTPLAPAKMLFTVKRGLFLWTPLTVLATVGLALLIRRVRERRAFLVALAAMGLALVLIHGVWGDFWTNGFSFSQRFLAALFPLFLLGTAEIARRFGRAGYAALTLCAAFSLFVGLNVYVGYKGQSEKDGLDRVLRLYTSGERNPIDLVRDLGVRARTRWTGG
jgi:hypothetical protein